MAENVAGKPVKKCFKKPCLSAKKHRLEEKVCTVCPSFSPLYKQVKNSPVLVTLCFVWLSKSNSEVLFPVFLSAGHRQHRRHWTEIFQFLGSAGGWSKAEWTF